MRAMGGGLSGAPAADDALTHQAKVSRARTARRQLCLFAVGLVLLAAVMVQIVRSSAAEAVALKQQRLAAAASARAAEAARLSTVDNAVACDADCTDLALDRSTAEELYPLLHSLTRQPFFRYFSVSLYDDCPFWPDDSVCMLPECSVCECPADEVPLPWRTSQPALELAAPTEPEGCAEGATDSASGEGLVDRTLDAGAGGWREGGDADVSSSWLVENGNGGEGAQWVNLLLNPERFTGYTGEHARRVWQAIYAQPCFAGLGGLCAAAPSGGGGGPPSSSPEAKLFFRLVSGLHASISVHIAADYPLKPGVWGANPALYQERVGSHPERLANMRLTHSFLLLAVQRAGRFLATADYSTGWPAEDAETAALVGRVLAYKPPQPAQLDESLLEGAAAREALRGHFRNVSAVMNCVGCEKCRLWGKLQTAGLGVALKVLFGGAEQLRRNEVIALLNTLHRLSESIATGRELAAAYGRQGGQGALPPPGSFPY